MTANDINPTTATKSTYSEAPAEAASDALTGNPGSAPDSARGAWVEVRRRAIDTVRVLAMDGVQNVGNGTSK